MKMRRLFLFLILCLGISGPLKAFETDASAAMIVDQTTGTVLLAKNADRPVPPASMSKLMTLHMLFEALDEGRVTMDTKFLVSEKANAIGGSTMFLRTGERVSVRDLIQGIIVQSGNDACVAVAENLAGSEDAFAERMTQRAIDLGMTGSTFGNSTGWPHPNQRMSARDLVYLANRLITKFPEYYTFFKQQSFTWDGVKQENRNPLLTLGIGADGLKTGHTEEAGYGLVGSAVSGKRRIIFMITGLQSKTARAQEAEKLTNWAFRQFASKKLFDEGSEIARANVWLGNEKSVGLVAKNEITGLVPLGAAQGMKARVTYLGPIEAPVKKGDKLADLTISIPEMEDTTHALYASDDILEGGIMTRVLASAQLLGTDLLGGKLWSKN